MNYQIIKKKYLKSAKRTNLQYFFVRYFGITYIHRIGITYSKLINLIDSMIIDDILRIILSDMIPEQPHEIKCHCGKMMYIKCKSVCYLSISAVCKRWNKLIQKFLVKNVKWYSHLLTGSCLKFYFLKSNTSL